MGVVWVVRPPCWEGLCGSPCLWGAGCRAREVKAGLACSPPALSFPTKKMAPQKDQAAPLAVLLASSGGGGHASGAPIPSGARRRRGSGSGGGGPGPRPRSGNGAPVPARRSAHAAPAPPSRRGRAWVVVLGDFGRSPRMQYHALSLAEQVRNGDEARDGERAFVFFSAPFFSRASTPALISHPLRFLRPAST